MTGLYIILGIVGFIIFLLNDIYHPYDDELLGWKVICLKGELNNIKNAFLRDCRKAFFIFW